MLLVKAFVQTQIFRFSIILSKMKFVSNFRMVFEKCYVFSYSILVYFRDNHFSLNEVTGIYYSI